MIDAYQVAQDTGMGGRINTIMQTCFFAISGILPREEAIEQIKKAIKKTYGKRGEAVVKKNFEAVDADSRAPQRGQARGAQGGFEVRPPPGRSGGGARIRQEGARPDDRERGRIPCR